MPLVTDILAYPERYDQTLVDVARWLEGDGKEEVEAAYAEERERQSGANPQEEREQP